jgi:hypothetical protein
MRGRSERVRAILICLAAARARHAGGGNPYRYHVKLLVPQGFAAGAGGKTQMARRLAGRAII